jgi:ribosomal protein S12 methylthiotransferase accessory factor
MQILIDFPGGSRADAHFENFTVLTDQPPTSSAPTPFELFLASIGTCAGIYVLGFCQQRGLDPNGIRIVQRTRPNPSSGLIEQIDLEILLPPTFPEKYHDSLIRAAGLCKVKKHLEQPPRFNITTQLVQNDVLMESL